MSDMCQKLATVVETDVCTLALSMCSNSIRTALEVDPFEIAFVECVRLCEALCKKSPPVSLDAIPFP